MRFFRPSTLVAIAFVSLLATAILWWFRPSDEAFLTQLGLKDQFQEDSRRYVVANDWIEAHKADWPEWLVEALDRRFVERTYGCILNENEVTESKQPEANWVRALRKLQISDLFVDYPISDKLQQALARQRSLVKLNMSGPVHPEMMAVLQNNHGMKEFSGGQDLPEAELLLCLQSNPDMEFLGLKYLTTSIGSWPKLRSLYLYEAPISADFWKDLSACRDLTMLDIVDTSLRIPEALPPWPAGLLNVHLDVARIPDSAFVHLSACRGLISLSVEGKFRDAACVDCLSHLPALTELSIVNHLRGKPFASSPSPEWLATAQRWSLKSLKCSSPQVADWLLHHAQVTPEGLDLPLPKTLPGEELFALSIPEKLKSLNASQCRFAAPISSRSVLSSCRLDRCQIPSDFLKNCAGLETVSLSNLKGLKNLLLPGGKLKDVNLTGISSLEHVSFHDPSTIQDLILWENPHLDIAGIPPFPDMKRVTFASLPKFKIGDLTRLCPSEMLSLRLIDCPDLDQGLAEYMKLQTKLNSLTLCDCGSSAFTLPPMPSLNWLELTGNVVKKEVFQAVDMGLIQQLDLTNVKEVISLDLDRNLMLTQARLRDLGITHSQITGNCFRQGSWPCLYFLKLSHSPLKVLPDLKLMPNLSDLSLDHCGLRSLEGLEAADSGLNIDLSHNPLAPGSLKVFKVMPELNLEHCELLPEAELMSAVKPTAYTLSFAGTQMSPEGMKRLIATHPDVCWLSFGNATWPSGALRDFPWPETLDSLTLFAVELPPEELPKLASCYTSGTLDYASHTLTLDRCRNLPELLPLFSQFTVLRHLELTHGDAPAAAWLKLKIPPHLESLDLRHSPVPKALLALLTAQLRPDGHLKVSAFGTGLTREDFAPWPQLEASFDAD